APGKDPDQVAYYSYQCYPLTGPSGAARAGCKFAYRLMGQPADETVAGAGLPLGPRGSGHSGAGGRRPPPRCSFSRTGLLTTAALGACCDPLGLSLATSSPITYRTAHLPGY